MSRSTCCKDEAAQEEAQPGPKSHQAPGRSNGVLFGARWLGRLWRGASARKFPGQRLLRVQWLRPSHHTLLSQDTSAFGPCLLYASTFGESGAGPSVRSSCRLLARACMLYVWVPLHHVECGVEVLVVCERVRVVVHGVCACACDVCGCARCWPSCVFANIVCSTCERVQGIAGCAALRPLQRGGEGRSSQPPGAAWVCKQRGRGGNRARSAGGCVSACVSPEGWVADAAQSCVPCSRSSAPGVSVSKLAWGSLCVPFPKRPPAVERKGVRKKIP
jgi:hypothetical protein